jgi:hypothetical protein
MKTAAERTRLGRITLMIIFGTILVTAWSHNSFGKMWHSFNLGKHATCTQARMAEIQIQEMENVQNYRSAQNHRSERHGWFNSHGNRAEGRHCTRPSDRHCARPKGVVVEEVILPMPPMPPVAPR